MLNEPDRKTEIPGGAEPAPSLDLSFGPAGLLRRDLANPGRAGAERVIEGMRPESCRAIGDERVAELHAQHLSGLRLLEGIPTWKASTLTAGMEVEMQLVDLSGAPSGECTEVSRQVEASGFSVVPECGRHVIEVNSSVRKMVGGFLRDYERELRRAIESVSSTPELNGRDVCLTGTQPSIAEADLSLSCITPKDRYLALVEALAALKGDCPPFAGQELDGRDGPGRISIERDRLEIEVDGERFVMRSPPGTVLTATIQSLMTSIQFHWSVPDIADYVSSHRLADLISPITVAAGSNSPLALGAPTGLKAARLPLWQACAHPERAGLGSRWISDPFDQLREAAGDEPVARPLLEPSAGKTAGSLHNDVRALIEQAKTHWPMNRTTLGLAPGLESGTMRVEHRPVCTASTIIDNIANAALFYGLMAGMPDHLRSRYGLDLSVPADQLEGRLPFERVRASLSNATARGLQARVLWIDGEERTAGELLERELLPVARAGLRKLLVPEADIVRYLGVIERRVGAPRDDGEIGTSGADIQIALWRSLDHLEEGERGRALARLLCQARSEDTYSRPQDIVTWYEKNFGAC